MTGSFAHARYGWMRHSTSVGVDHCILHVQMEVTAVKCETLIVTVT